MPSRHLFQPTTHGRFSSSGRGVRLYTPTARSRRGIEFLRWRLAWPLGRRHVVVDVPHTRQDLVSTWPQLQQRGAARGERSRDRPNTANTRLRQDPRCSRGPGDVDAAEPAHGHRQLRSISARGGGEARAIRARPKTWYPARRLARRIRTDRGRSRGASASARRPRGRSAAWPTGSPTSPGTFSRTGAVPTTAWRRIRRTS